jgi:2-polyprenyl-6-methoxyphenol hydroxylase-like FAD-dependent oxidoreductase
MAQPFDVCIRGAGIVGRSLALLLAQHRLRVGLVQAPTPPSPLPPVDNRAYALNSASRSLLQGLRCWPEGNAVTPVNAMHVFGDAGGQVNFTPKAHEGTPAGLAWIVDVPALEACLANAVRFQPHIELIDTPQPAALTVVCEGRFSSTRAEFGVDFDVTPYGQHAIAARLDCTLPHQGQAFQWFANGEVMAFLPLAGGLGNSVALVWSVSEARAQALCTLEPTDFATEAEAASANQLGALSLLGARARWPLQQGQAQRWSGTTAVGQAWVLAGDAAHTVHPLGGQGLNLGLADVAELAQILGARDYWRSVGDTRLLRQYERARRAGLAPVGAVMDGLQRLFAQPDATAKNLRNWGMQGFERSGLVKDWVVTQAMGMK